MVFSLAITGDMSCASIYCILPVVLAAQEVVDLYWSLSVTPATQKLATGTICSLTSGPCGHEGLGSILLLTDGRPCGPGSREAVGLYCSLPAAQEDPAGPLSVQARRLKRVLAGLAAPVGTAP